MKHRSKISHAVHFQLNKKLGGHQHGQIFSEWI